MDNEKTVVTVINPQHSRSVPQNPKSVDKRPLRERDEKQFNAYMKQRKLRFNARRNLLKKAGHKPGAKARKCKRCGVLAGAFDAEMQCAKKKKN